jgi:hypothetical protein
MRRFFLEYRECAPRISQTVSGKSARGVGIVRYAGRLERSWRGTGIPATPFMLSWSHYIFLMAIDDRDERSFYEHEAAQNGWSVRELHPQFDSGLYERLSLSQDGGRRRELSIDRWPEIGMNGRMDGGRRDGAEEEDWTMAGRIRDAGDGGVLG